MEFYWIWSLPRAFTMKNPAVLFHAMGFFQLKSGDGHHVSPAPSYSWRHFSWSRQGLWSLLACPGQCPAPSYSWRPFSWSRQGLWSLLACPGQCPAPLLFLHAANGETVRTVVAVFGAHAGTVEAQARPVHARRRRRRTAPGVTARAHIVQAAGTAGAVTRSGG